MAWIIPSECPNRHDIDRLNVGELLVSLVQDHLATSSVDVVTLEWTNAHHQYQATENDLSLGAYNAIKNH